MSGYVKCMTFEELKETIKRLENDPAVTNETKILLDTGWDSLQEVLPEAIAVEVAKPFQVQDELTKEYFGGYVLADKEQKFENTGEEEAVIVLKNLY